MALYKSAIPIDEKELNVGVGTQHPWAKIVKDYLSQRIKYVHNSIRNPEYPVKKQNQPCSLKSDSNRVQFTVIGDRVTKEFIFCANLVRGLHKYRWKNFDVPQIRGVSTIEWPHIWNDLKIRFGTVANCLLSSVAVFMNDQIIGGEKELKQLVEKQYIYHLCLDYYNEGVKEFARFIKSSGRPTAYMHVSINNVHIGTLIFMLYADIVPYTCENFLRLCKERRGGYGGTPVHRIVKDGWIQCGGFGLKNTPLSCENFIIPLDKRGVLAMANDGRDVDCSTQFFVLLQPAPWMNHKYVAFGQLIEGAATLEKIESVTTFYESPISKIILYRCGIFNMECQGMITKGLNAYIDGHIEDLTDFTDRLWAYILEQVFLSAQLREIERLREQGGEGAESTSEDDAIRPTQRFKKEDIEKQLVKNQEDQHSTEDDNKDFDVDEYIYEPEEDAYKHESLHPASLIVKPQRPYYIPLTDVPYPGDVDSNFDLKRLLKGDYCLESDLKKHALKITKSSMRFPSELLMQFESEISGSKNGSEGDSETEMDEELIQYVKDNVDRISFAGGVVKSIAKKGTAKFNLFDDASIDSRNTGHINDEKLRRIRIASVDLREKEMRLASGKVSINAAEKAGTRIKRRQTGFVRQKDLENIGIINESSHDHDDDDDDESSKTVRMNPIAVVEANNTHPDFASQRRLTGFIRPADFGKFISNYDHDDDDADDDDDGDDDIADDDVDDVASASSNTAKKIIEKKPYFRVSAEFVVDDDNFHTKPSVLERLFNQVDVENEEAPTLKNYKALGEMQRKNTLLTYSPVIQLLSNESTRAKYTRSLKAKDSSVDPTLDLQHGKKITRKISSDYVKTIEKDHKIENSLRSVEYAKKRPTISVSDYRLKNRMYREQQMSNEVNTVLMPPVDFDASTGNFQSTRDGKRISLDVIHTIK